MKKWFGGMITFFLLMVLVIRFFFIKDSLVEQNYLPPTFFVNSTNPLEWVRSAASSQDVHSTTLEPAIPSPQPTAKVIPADNLTLSLFTPRNKTVEDRHSLLTWNRLKNFTNHSLSLPKALDAIREATIAWDSLMDSVNLQRLSVANGSSSIKAKEKQCPHYFNKMNATGLSVRSYTLPIPCGLTQGSSITIIGIPNGNLGNFRIDLTVEQIPGEPEPPIVLHYNVRIHGDKLTDEPVIVQNTWTAAHDGMMRSVAHLKIQGRLRKMLQTRLLEVVLRIQMVLQTRLLWFTSQSSIFLSEWDILSLLLLVLALRECR